jgi:hypothetical protein
VEFGHVRRDKPTILIRNAGQVKALADILPEICASMCRGEKYEFGDGDFRLNTVTGGWLVARMTLNKRYISLKLNELQHLLRMFHVVQKQVVAYTNAMPEVLSYITTALSSTAYTEPAPDACKHIAYPQLYDELKTVL